MATTADSCHSNKNCERCRIAASSSRSGKPSQGDESRGTSEMTKAAGWLKDRYGVSWQIIPRVMAQMRTDEDPAKANGVMQTMMQMKKIDIAQLKRAYERG